jgi:hypothetical protein
VKVVAWFVIALCACGASSKVEETGPTASVAPDEFMLRDLRRDAGRRLNCQSPSVELEMGPWSGSEGNVTAYACGLRINYYLRCQTAHQCSMTVTD